MYILPTTVVLFVSSLSIYGEGTGHLIRTEMVFLFSSIEHNTVMFCPIEHNTVMWIMKLS